MNIIGAVTVGFLFHQFFGQLSDLITQALTYVR